MKNSYIVATALLLAACGDGSAPSGNTTAQPASVAPVALGQTGKAGNLDMTVTGVATPSSVGPAEAGLKAEAGETYVVVSYTIKNTGSAPLSFMERPAVSLIDPRGQAYAVDDVAGPAAAMTAGDTAGLASDLNTNVSAKTKAGWKVDKAAFDKATWRLSVATDPVLTFALK